MLSVLFFLLVSFIYPAIHTIAIGEVLNVGADPGLILSFCKILPKKLEIEMI